MENRLKFNLLGFFFFSLFAWTNKRAEYLAKLVFSDLVIDQLINFIFPNIIPHFHKVTMNARHL